MSRKMTGANQAIFERLDQYCSDFNNPIANAGSSRWIATNGYTHFFRHARLALKWEINPRTCLAIFSLEQAHYLVTVNFKPAPPPANFSDLPLSGEILSTVLYELAPRPTATSMEVRDKVEVDDKESSGGGYVGHDPEQIASLYPDIFVSRAENFLEDDIWRIFFLRALSELNGNHYWPNADLVAELQSLSQLDTLKIPYETLCRSVFDTDQSSLFLALYRCLEAVYAYRQTNKIIANLTLAHSWKDVARELEETLGWRPQEESSLCQLLRLADPSDLRQIHALLSPPDTPAPSDETLPDKTGRVIYKTRNRLVHYRPAMKLTETGEVDWDAACALMTFLVFTIYGRPF